MIAPPLARTFATVVEAMDAAVVVLLDTLPLTSMLKVDEAALREQVTPA